MPLSGSGRPVLVRITERISIEDRGYSTPCHIWLGPVWGGYGIIRVGSRTDGTRRMLKTHRIMYEAARGPIPVDLIIDHLCYQLLCCNPEHLEAVTIGENIRRGTAWLTMSDLHRSKTHCIHGHEFTKVNTYLHTDSKGRVTRHCRECKNRRWREMYQRRKVRAADGQD